MRVESLIRRAQGHAVQVHGVTYAFAPPDWSCEVGDPAHVAHFAQLVNGYRVVETPAPFLTLQPALWPPPAAAPSEGGSTPELPLGENLRGASPSGLDNSPPRRTRKPLGKRPPAAAPV